jgi:hypothetical protein
MRKPLNLLRQALLIGLLVTLAPALSAEPAPTLIEFKLKDQFDTEHDQQQAAGKVVFILGSDGEGSEFNDAWGEAVHNALSDHPRHADLHQLPYADLRSVPFFAKGFARRMMPEEPENWVLMDWKGSIAKAYEFQVGATNMLVFASDGSLTAQFSGRELDNAILNKLVTELRRQLDTLSITAED